MFWRKFDAKNYAVRKGNEKIVLKSGTEEMLFDLDQDISEQKNLSTERKENAKQLSGDLRKWESELQYPTFLGLTQDKEYNEIHPDRFIRQKKYYFNPESKSAKSDGSFNHPFQDLNKLSSLKLNPGDSILLASGTTSRGSVALRNVQGSADQPIVISSYNWDKQSAEKLATIDAKGFPNGILLENCSHIDVTNLIITANSGGMKTADGKTPDMRCGVLVQTTKPGNYGHVRLIGLQVKEIFYEEPGFIRGNAEVNSANGTQRYGWGIRFINNTDGALLQDLKVMNCEINNTAHTGLKFTAKGH